MKRKLLTLISLSLGFLFSYAQDPNVVGGKSSVKIDFKKINYNTKETHNESKNLSLTAEAITDDVDDSDCLKDPKTGECVDIEDTDGSGSTSGSLSISLTGAANYSIPIMVPPGIKDVAPNVSISYTSQGANGLAGWGWNISGLSTISRIPATKYYDNKQDGIDFKDDRFSIDGQRLILKSGTYGASGSVYQTENYSSVKVLAYGSSPYGSTYGPSYFIVYYPNGTRAWYGNSGNSRSRLEWAIFRWQDPQGNYIDYNYQSDNGLLSIKTIKYGGRIGGTSPTNQINFTYTTRSRPENVFVGEYNFKRTNLLRRIQITASGSQYRKYDLTHSTTSLGYQRLTSVKEYNAKNKALRPITFGYETTSASIPTRKETRVYPGFDYKTSDLIAGDYDGDGNTDVIYYNKNTRDKLYMHTRLYKETSIAYQINTQKFSDLFSSTILSWNNKILSQQAVTTVSETSSSNSSTSSIRFRTFAQAPYGPVHQYDKVWTTSKYRTDNYCGSTSYLTIPKKYVSGDFNGDGLTDVIAVEKLYTTRRCRLSDCDKGGERPKDFLRKKVSSDQKDINTSIDKTQARLPDPDCCECNTSTSNQYNAKVHFIDLKRTVTSNFAKVSGYFRKSVSSKDKILAADHNGDGKQDIYHFKEGKLYVYTLNSTNNLVLIHEETDSGIKLDYPILFGDFNGDGKTDFVVATANKSKYWRFYISKGKNFYKQTKYLPFAYYKDKLTRGKRYHSGVLIYDPYYEYRYTAQDVNGDGKTDLIMHNTIAPYSAYDRSVEYISIYKNNQSSSSITPSFSYETGYTNTSGEVGKFGKRIFLESNVTNGNLEYGYISVNNIFMYEFAKDHRKDVALKSVNNNGVKVSIDYERLGLPDSPYGPRIYTPDYNQNYPFVNINRASSFQLVKKLTEEGAGIKRYQDFRYHGAVSNINIGFQGFLKTKRSNWYGNGVGTLWTISKHDVTKKGAVTEQWVSTSSYEGNSYMSKTTNTFSTNLASNKVFTNIPTKVVQHNALNGVTTTRNYTYDSYKNLLTENTTYNGGSKKVTYAYSNNAGTNSQYYHIGRITKKIETNTIGGNTFTIEEQYSHSNNLLTQQKVKGNGTPWNTESFTYDAFGNVTRKTLSPSGMSSRTEHFKYDTSGRFLIESTDIEGLKTKFTYDHFGNPLSTTNPYNQVTRFYYDSWNRLTSEKNYLGKTTTFSYTYISGGGLRKTTNYPQGADEVVEYNALGWILKSRVLGINNKWTEKSVQYDVAGRIIKESEPYFSSPSQWNSVAYDQYGREIVHRKFNGQIVNISYNGLTTTVNDGVKTVKTTKDGGGNIIKLQDPGGAITYTYHGNGVMKTANYGGNIVRTEIDGWGRKMKLIDPSAGTYTYKYNSIGEVLEETTPKGKTNYGYDSFGKLLQKNVTGSETKLSSTYTYNNTTKLLTKISAYNGRTKEHSSYNYQYDSRKRLISTTESNGKAYFKHHIIYDTYGRVYRDYYYTKYYNSNTVSTVLTYNVYDSACGELTAIKDSNNQNTLWKLNKVNARGQAENITLGNGMTKKRYYDANGHLTQIIDQGSSSTALSIKFNFDAQRGNLLSRANATMGWSETFTYDSLDRLKQVNGQKNRHQSYDNRGRIITNSIVGKYNYKSTTSYQLKNINLNTTGNNYYKTHSTQDIVYNAFKKPVSVVTKNKGRTNFDYGVLQNRSHAYYGGQEADKTKRRYHKHYSAISPVEIEFDKTTGNTKIMTYIGGDAYSAPIVHLKQTKSGESNGYHYLHRDYLGSILAITNSSGTVLERRQFGAWGTVDKFVDHKGKTTFGHSSLINRGYTGHEHFFEIDLIHMNGRMYDANLGRFLSPDNYIQEPFNTQNFNRYGYVLNNPLKYTDASGEFFWIAVAIGAFMGGVTAAMKGGDFGDILLGALIGGIAGGIGAGVGNLVAGGAFIGGKAMAASGFLNGALAGAAGGFAAGFSGAALNTWANGGNFGDGLAAGFKAGVQGALVGAAVGGITGGVRASKQGKGFWSGKVNEVGGVSLRKGDFLLNEKISKGHKPTDTGEIAKSTGPNANDKYGKYGWTRNGGAKMHKGVDYVTTDGGNSYAMYDGKVSYTGPAQGYGNMVQIKSTISGKMYNVDYGHFKSFSIKVGQSIKAGDLLGKIGRVGNIIDMSAKHYPTHVHVSVWRYVNGNRGFVKPWW